MIADSITPEDVVKVLNSAMKADRVTIQAMIFGRVTCNQAMADHPTIQVGQAGDGSFEVGILGIINGLFGVDERDGYGPIAAKLDKGRVVGFAVIKGGGP